MCPVLAIFPIFVLCVNLIHVVQDSRNQVPS